MQIEIEKIVSGGLGLGFANGGKPIFVAKSVPGDKLEINIIEEKKHYAFGAISKILSPSKLRIKPACPYFDFCGGCDHQNISYPNQLKIKEAVFLEVLTRAGINVKPHLIIAGSNQPLFYRNSIRFFFLYNDDKITFARKHFYKSDKLIAIDSCLLQSETANLILATLKNYINAKVADKSPFWQLKIRQGKSTAEFMVEIITTFDHLPDKEGIVEVLKNIKGIKSIYHTVAPAKSLKNLQRHLIFGSPIIREKIGRYTFQISPQSFFQTNSLGVKILYDIIKNYADIKIGQRVLDLYCGTGTIGLYLSSLAKEIVGVESLREAVNDANDNARLNKVLNVQFVQADVDKFLNSSIGKFDVIITDPPRAGLTKQIIQKIAQLKAKKIIYVSCNPPTFARDIKIFEQHGWRLSRLQPIDMFPQTHHLEIVSELVR